MSNTHKAVSSFVIFIVNEFFPAVHFAQQLAQR